MESCRPKESRRGSQPVVGIARRRRWHPDGAQVGCRVGCGVKWCGSGRQADLDDGNAPGVSTAESKRIYDLDQEIRRFKRANEILKRAAVASGGVRPPAKEVVGFIDANRGDFGDGAICMGRALGESEHVQREQASKPVGAARACRTPSWKPASRQLGEDNNRVYVARKLWKAARRAG